MLNNKTHWTHREPRKTSKLFLLAMTALLLLLLIASLTGCGSIKTEYVLAPNIPIPASLLADCPIPDIPDKMTWGDIAEYNIELMSVIKACNLDKKAIREIEAERNK
nr:Rz1 lytic protein [Providencia rettgeri]